MRFYDLIMQDKAVSPEIKNDLDGLVVVSCDNVARYYFEESDQEYWDMKDFPNVAPPFERYWLDFQAPARIVSKEHGTIPWSQESPTHWGFLCLGTRFTQDTADPFLHDAVWGHYAEHFEPYISQAKWGLDLYLDWHMQGIFYGPIWVWRALVDETGAFVRHADGKHVLSALMVDETMRDSVDVFTQMFGSREAAFSQAYTIIVPYLHTALLSLSFLHCRNVSLDQVTPPTRHVHNKAQKRRGERDYRPVPYKVLNIQPMKAVLRREGESDTAGTKKALHICRGHFMHYQEGRGLFGKYPGTFWQPMHVRGTSHRGVATKDYKIDLE